MWQQTFAIRFKLMFKNHTVCNIKVEAIIAEHKIEIKFFTHYLRVNLIMLIYCT